jgi:PAS domain S-box-containing protein
VVQANKIRSQAILVIAFVLLSCCAASGLWLAGQKRKADAWVRHTFEVKDDLSDVRVGMLRAEVYRRSYASSGTDHARAGLDGIRAELPAAIRALSVTTSDNPPQRARAAALGRLAMTRLHDAAETIRLRDSGRSEEATAALDSAASARKTTAIVKLIGQIRGEEERLLAIRLKKAKDLERPIQGVLLSSGLLVLLLALLVMRERRHRLVDLHEANMRLQADIARREVAERELALLAANATDAVLRLDLEGSCIYASPSVEHVLGIQAAALNGRTMSAGIDPADIDELRTFHQLLVSGTIERGVITYRAIRGDDPTDTVWIEAHSGLVRDPVSGQPREVIASLRDISERKRLELELDGARARAEAAAKTKSSFLANMSHEIRTPMNGVLGFADLLLHGDISEEHRRYAQLIVDSGRAMMRLLNDILDLSKIEAGQMQVSPEAIDLRHALRNCVKLIQPAAAQKELALELDIDEALPECVLLDGLRLRQITLHLLGNAVKFTDAGRVTVRAGIVAGSDGRAFEVSVADTGIGISLDRQAAVFEQFTQAEQSTASRFGGTGLGLAISKQLATLMGGSLDLISEQGHGTTFTLRLPLLAATLGKAGPTPGLAGSSVHRPLRVLLAEDHDVNQELMTAMLAQLGHQNVIVANGLEALHATVAADRDGPAFDLVLMDMQMPVMDGVEATRKIRAAGITAARLPILALTATAYADDVAACRQAGMQAHLAKPVQLADLAAAIGKWTATPAKPAAATAPAFTISPALQARFDARKAELAAFARGLSGASDDDGVRQLAALLHKLAGSAAMFNQKALGARAAELEEKLEAAAPDERAALIGAVIASLEAAA